MSNLEPFWTERQAAEAAGEGWQLAWVVDSGKSISTARIEVFDTENPRFKSRHDAMKFVSSQALARSKLHLEAMQALSASRIPPQTKRKK